MNGRERISRTLRFEHPDRVPRDLWRLPGIEMFRRDELEALLARYPTDMVGPPNPYPPSQRAAGTPNVVGSYTDDWGCVWTVAEPGVVGEVKRPPLDDWTALDGYEPPWEILDGADFERVDRFCAETNQFVLGGTSIRPFERMQFLRGSEQLFLDIGYSPDALYRLRDRVHDFYIKELALWCQSAVDGISFMDDWGAQHRLLIAPSMWRELFKPLYAEYVQMIHDAGKFAFMHSDGHISDIIPDLIEIGVDALNSQLFCMDIEQIGERYRGQITFWGEIDRQGILPFGQPEDARAAVARVRRALASPAGGVIAQCEWGLDVPRANIEAVFDAWNADTS